MGAADLRDLLVRPRVGELLGNTVLLLVATVAAATVIGVTAAVAVVRTDVPMQPWWHVLLSAPLAVPAFVNSYGWVSMTHAVQSYWGAVLVVTLSYYPLVYLPVVATLVRLEAAPEEVATSLGRSRWQTFWLVVLPRLSPAVLGERCWWACTSWPSSELCSCWPSRRSPRPSTRSTARRSPATPELSWPACSSPCAFCC